MRTFKRNKETGILEVYDGDNKIGEISTMGDAVKKNGVNNDGGPGSGNFGHKGVKGQVGGSAPSSGGTSGSSSWGAKCDKDCEEALKMPNNKQAAALYKCGYMSQDDALAAMNDGSISEHTKAYYDLLKKNGDTTPTKPLSDNEGLDYSEVNTKWNGNWEDARIENIKNLTKCSDEDAITYNDELQTWFSGSWRYADTTVLNKFIDEDHAYNGKLYRGLHLEHNPHGKTESEIHERYDELMFELRRTGVYKGIGQNQSWSTNKEVSLQFSHPEWDDEDSVVLHCLKNRTSSPVNSISSKGEDEVLSHSKAVWTVLRIDERQDKSTGKRSADVYLIEKGSYLDGVEKHDSADPTASAVIVVKDGYILCGDRANGEGICGPGGHIEKGEKPDKAAIREAAEEFSILPKNLQKVGVFSDDTGNTTMLYFTDEFFGEPETDNREMFDARWMSLKELSKEDLFPPFENSLNTLISLLTQDNPSVKIKLSNNTDGGAGSGNHGHKGIPGQKGGSAPRMSNKEKAKFLRRLVGFKTSDGITITGITDHAFERIAERRISVGRIEKTLTNGEICNGNTANRNTYDYDNGRVVVDSKNGNIVTIM